MFENNFHSMVPQGHEDLHESFQPAMPGIGEAEAMQYPSAESRDELLGASIPCAAEPATVVDLLGDEDMPRREGTPLIDAQGVVHTGRTSQAQDVPVVLGMNATRVDNKPFAAPGPTESEEFAQLVENVSNGSPLNVDAQGTVHYGDMSASAGNGAPVVLGMNATRVDDKPFAAPGPTESEEFAQLVENVSNGSPLNVDAQGTVHYGDMSASAGNGAPVVLGMNATRVDDKPFAAPEPAAAAADQEYWLDSYGAIHQGPRPASEAGQALNDTANEPVVLGVNATRVDNKPFAAPGITAEQAIARYPDQWYARNPGLMKAEIKAMQTRFPKASYGFFSQDGTMYWVVQVQVHRLFKPWTFMLRYDKTHPQNAQNFWGGTIKVVPIAPSIDDLYARARAATPSRKGVPHIIRGASRADGEKFRYLCTRSTEAVNDGRKVVTSAAQVVGWAVDWAIHFETGLVDKGIWNKWCDDEPFRGLMLP